MKGTGTHPTSPLCFYPHIYIGSLIIPCPLLNLAKCELSDGVPQTTRSCSVVKPPNMLGAHDKFQESELSERLV